MTDVAIRVENLSKRYRIGLTEEMPDSLASVLAGWFNSPLANYRRLRGLSHFDEDGRGAHRRFERDSDDIIWALKDVSFEVQQGEVVGIIGHNGAGKSTLLKILTRIVEPTSGKAIINGRVSSLLEVGTGFHPELTGRENVYLNGSILGMARGEIDRKFDEIVDFSGVEKFIDTPIKRYSSGMQVRLAFAVAAHLEPEIMLVDEVLAVGDVEFQQKCLGKMGEVASSGRTVLLVSHQLPTIESLCARTILMESGGIKSFGPAATIVHEYVNSLHNTPGVHLDSGSVGNRSGDGRIRLRDFHVEDADGIPISVIRNGEDVLFVFTFCAEENLTRSVDLGFSVHSSVNDQLLFVNYSSYQNRLFEIDSSSNVIKCRIRRFPLAKGRYRIGARILVKGIEADWPRAGVGTIEVTDGDFYGTGRIEFSRRSPFLVLGDWFEK